MKIVSARPWLNSIGHMYNVHGQGEGFQQEQLITLVSGSCQVLQGFNDVSYPSPN